VLKWKRKKLNRFKSRLNSTEYIQSHSILTELLIAHHLLKQLGKDIELFPELDTGKFSDIRVQLGDRDVFFEVVNLGERVPQSKIQEILDGSSQHLGKKIDVECYLCLVIDTAELVFDSKGRIDVSASVNKLNLEIDMISIQNLAGFKGYFNIGDIAYMLDLVSRHPDVLNWLTPNDNELFNLISNNTIISRWLQTFNHELFQKIKLIKSIITGPTDSLLIEIHPEGLYPSTAAKLDRESFLHHIVRNVKSQVTSLQIQPHSPNIIVIQGTHWTFGFNYDLFSRGSLIDRIITLFKEIMEKYLSGIAIFGTHFEEALYINNNYAQKTSQLHRQDILDLGFKEDRIIF
jgi:hypothetical protein